jgi:hypothetical protein
VNIQPPLARHSNCQPNASTGYSYILGTLIAAAVVLRHSSVVWGQFLVRNQQYEDVADSLALAALGTASISVAVWILLLPAFSRARSRAGLLKFVRLAPFYLICLALALVSIPIALVEGNSNRYILSDTYNLIQPFMIGALSAGYAAIVRPTAVRWTVGILAISFGLAALVNSASSLIYFGNLSPAAGGNSLLIGFVAAIAALKYAPNRHAKLWLLLITALVTLPVLLSLKRAVWIAAIGGVGLVSIQDALSSRRRDRRRPRSAKTLVFWAGSTVAVAWTLLSGAPLVGMDGVAEPITRRFAQIGEAAAEYRVSEASAAIDDLTRRGAFAWIAGAGTGATFDVAAGAQSKAELHNIHVTPVAVLYRHGVTGLVLLVVALSITVVRLSRLRNRGPIEWMTYVYFVMLIITSLSAYTLVPDAFAATMIGFVAGSSVFAAWTTVKPRPERQQSIRPGRRSNRVITALSPR